MVDQEVKKFMDDAYEQAKSILTEKKEKLDEIAQVLIDKETIEKEEFEKLVKN